VSPRAKPLVVGAPGSGEDRAGADGRRIGLAWLLTSLPLPLVLRWLDPYLFALAVGVAFGISVLLLVVAATRRRAVGWALVACLPTVAALLRLLAVRWA
jgi:hypothetical protein